MDVELVLVELPLDDTNYLDHEGRARLHASIDRGPTSKP